MISHNVNTKRDYSIIIARASSSPFSNAMTTAEVNWRTNRRSADDETDEKEGISVVWQTLGKPTLMKIISSVYILGVPSLLSVLCEPAIGCTESLLVRRVGMVYLAAIAPSSVMFWLIEEVCFALSVGVTTAVSEASAARSLISLDELDEVGGGGEKEEEKKKGNESTTTTRESRVRGHRRDERNCASERVSRVWVRHCVRARDAIHVRAGDANTGRIW